MRFVTGLLALLFILFNADHACAQTGCVSNTIIDLPCNVSCTPLKTKVDHIRSTEDYIVKTIPYCPLPFSTASGTELVEIYVDDKFSSVVNIPFSFCFYDSVYSKIVIGSNGIVSFDTSIKNKSNAYTLDNADGSPRTIPSNIGSAPTTISTTYYPRASIMGAYHDIYPNSGSAPPTRKIEYRTEGVAPFRRFVISYFDVPMFSCTSLINSQQIVLHESSGIIDVHFKSKPLCSGFNDGLAILGIQNWDRNKAVAAPGKNCTQWTAFNESYRFIPSGPQSRYAKSELLDISGNILVPVGDTVTTTPGLLDVSFVDQCPTALSTKYIVKTYFSSCSDPAVQFIVSDTVTVNKTNSLMATSSGIIPSACGPNGSFTVNIPAGAGTLPYLLSLDGALPVSVNGQSHTFSGLLGGSHSVLITTADGCTQMLPVTVPTSGTLNVTATTVATSCNGAANGSVTLTPQNGVQPFTYSINNGAPIVSNSASYTFSNLVPGNYFFKVTDASGCVLNNMLAQVLPGGPLTITTNAVAPACSGAANGSITVTPTSGTAPYTYSINSGAFQSNNVFSNLLTGTYFISVRDAIGCYINNVFVNVPVSTGSLNVTVTPMGTSCTGLNNGSISIVPLNGSSPYQYSLDGGTTFVAGTSITGLAPGNYSVIVKDNSGCTSASVPATISAGSALLATTATTPTSCNGVSNGTITVTPTNGSGPFNYQLDGGAAQTSNVFTNVAAGSHTIIVTDASGCASNSIPVTIDVGPPITGSFVTVGTSCNGAVNGTITVTPTTGSAPFSFQLDGGAFQLSNSFTGVGSGDHSIIIKDAAGCTSTAYTISVSAGPPLSGSAISSATSCSGATDGGITITPNTGISPYQYSLDGTNWQSSNVFTGLAPGAYTSFIKDGAGCITAAIPVSIAVGPGLTATTSTTPTSCSGATNGTITVLPGNTNMAYEFSIDGIGFQTSNTFSGLPTGNYTITFRNNAGCQGTVQATVNAGQPLTAAVNVNNVMCNGGNDGMATINISANFAPPVEYSLDGGTWQASNIFNGLTAGSYTAYFRDQNNCAGSQSFVITQPALLTLSPAEQSALCSGQNDGLIMLAASGGMAPYQFSIDGINYQPSNVFNVAAGSYTVYVKDNNNCIKTDVVNITEPNLLKSTINTTNATCDGGNDGTLMLDVSGGTPAYQYSLDGIYWQSSNVFNVSSGSYSVIVKDANGCTNARNAIVDLTNNLYVVPVNDTVVCEGVSVQLQPNTNATQFIWTPAQGLNNTNIREPIASPSITTDYIVQNILGVCTANDTIRVNIMPAPIPNAGPDGNICYGQNFQLQGSGGIEYSWSPATYMNTSLTPEPLVTPEQTIQYSLSVVDANGCRSLQPDIVTVNVTPPIVVKISNDTVVAMGDTLQIFASSVATDYLWSPAFGLDDPNKSAPRVTVTGDITYTVLASTSAGCKGSASVTLKVYDGPEVYVPTAFTPNGDGLNDLFKPFPVGIKNYVYFRVFNRWGQMIFATSDFNRGWDGTINGKTQPSGTYVWIVEGITKDNKKIVKRGTITLVR